MPVVKILIRLKLEQKVLFLEQKVLFLDGYERILSPFL